MSAITLDGKLLYTVEVLQQRRATLYVLADNPDDAQDDADELADGILDWEEIDLDCWVNEARKLPEPGTLVWSGGPEGKDVPWQ